MLICSLTRYYFNITNVLFMSLIYHSYLDTKFKFGVVITQTKWVNTSQSLIVFIMDIAHTTLIFGLRT